MALLPENQDDQLKFLGVMVLLGLGALYWLYWYAPRSDELQAREERVSQMEFENRRAEVRVGNLDELRQELDARRSAMEELERLIPSRAEVSGLYDQITRISQGLGLELVSVSPRPMVREEGQYFYRQRWSMVIEGGYHEIGRFLSDVASMSRLVRPAVSRVAPPSEVGEEDRDGGTVRAELDLETFVLPPADAPSEGAESDGAGGGEAGE